MIILNYQKEILNTFVPDNKKASVIVVPVPVNLRKDTALYLADENEYKDISYEILYGKINNALSKVEKILQTITRENFQNTYYYVLNNLLDYVLKSCVCNTICCLLLAAFLFFGIFLNLWLFRRRLIFF